MLSEIASYIRYIPLETTDECLISSDFETRFTGDAIFSSSHQDQSFYRFDKNGKFMNKIGKKGQGPGEYTNGLFYFPDIKNRFFYTYDWNDTYCYSYDGGFIRKVETPDLNMGTAEMLGDDMIAYCNDMFFSKKNTPNQVFIIDTNGKSIRKFRGKVEEGKRYGINLSTRDYMYIWNGDTYFKCALENIVYKITPKKKIPVWEFKLGNKDIDVTRSEINPQNRNKSISVYRIAETDKNMFVQYGLGNESYLGMYDKVADTFGNVRIVDDLSGGLDFLPSMKSIDGYLACCWIPKAFTALESSGTAKLENRENEYKSLLSSLDEEDNPVIVVVKLK